ncbi:effector binding domain-containing protein [Bacillus timonensis]|uniref:effector binding domain-containing protein n=1 Tax=Bacillus timonensis TaxID=1033734 RepID=UPI00028816BA|nr:effector binding domain-containing protein [Bacillus timonensis]
MECKKAKKLFRVVGIKGGGAFADFGSEVPKLAHQFMKRIDEIENSSGVEIALFEPKRDVNHLEGHYYVGVIVHEPLTEVPFGMVYMEVHQTYTTIRGNINHVGNLHDKLLNWTVDQGDNQNLETYIVETYHQMDNGMEEVEVFLPILT